MQEKTYYHCYQYLQITILFISNDYFNARCFVGTKFSVACFKLLNAVFPNFVTTLVRSWVMTVYAIFKSDAIWVVYTLTVRLMQRQLFNTSYFSTFIVAIGTFPHEGTHCTLCSFNTFNLVLQITHFPTTRTYYLMY